MTGKVEQVEVLVNSKGIYNAKSEELEVGSKITMSKKRAEELAKFKRVELIVNTTGKKSK